MSARALAVGVAIASMLGLASWAYAAQPELLDSRTAFQVGASYRAGTLEVRFRVAEGYYLYRDKIVVEVGPQGVRAGKLKRPAGDIKEDEFFGRSQVYRGEVALSLPVAASDPAAALVVKVRSQGCADAGVCYPPKEDMMTLAPGATVQVAPPRPKPGSLLDQLGEPATGSRR